jgi:sulfur-oxidizing protein SoxZ
MARVLINMPKQAQKGQVIEIRVLISHPMESGQRRTDSGEIIPRKIINKFVCAWNGEKVITVDFFPAIAANPFLSFNAVAEASGIVSITWEDDDGSVQTESVPITVT